MFHHHPCSSPCTLHTLGQGKRKHDRSLLRSSRGVACMDRVRLDQTLCGGDSKSMRGWASISIYGRVGAVNGGVVSRLFLIPGEELLREHLRVLLHVVVDSPAQTKHMRPARSELDRGTRQNGDRRAGGQAGRRRRGQRHKSNPTTYDGLLKSFRFKHVRNRGLQDMALSSPKQRRVHAVRARSSTVLRTPT